VSANTCCISVEPVGGFSVIGQTPTDSSGSARSLDVYSKASCSLAKWSAANDWQPAYTDSCIKLDVRLLLKTTDGALDRDDVLAGRGLELTACIAINDSQARTNPCVRCV